MAEKGEAKVTIDPEEIRRWAEVRGGKPKENRDKKIGTGQENRDKENSKNIKNKYKK
ncbi:MAG: hypothetical protein HY282_13245 [Nitrospirae bacterium]|nr:hypothetical protein [Candidatus Manganitrophaceae bacterium]